MSEEQILRPEEVASVLSGDETAPQESSAEGPKPYSLREPVAIPESAEAAARKRLERVSETLDTILDVESEDRFKVTVEGFQQQRAAAALSVLPGPVWVAGLTANRGGGIVLALQPTVAIALIERALGGEGDPPDEPREPTSLEGRVLSRWLGAVAGEIGEILGASLQPLAVEVDRVPERIAAAGETVGVSPVKFTIGDADHAALLLASASLLVPKSAAKPAAVSPGPLAARLERVSVPVRPVLPAGCVAMAELIALEPGTLLKFDIAEDAPLTLRAAGTPVAVGRVMREGDTPLFKIDSKVGSEPTEEAP